MGIKSSGSRRGMRGGRGPGGIPIRWILLALIAGGGWLFKNNKLPSWVGDLVGPPKEAGHQSQTGSFQTFTGKFQSDKGNDGDSFRISGPDGTHHLRLYYFDTPEKYISDFNSERVGHQARYFDCSKNDAVEVGIDAKKVTEGLLKRNPIRVHTVWEEVYDSGRYYAFIELNPDTPDAAYLCEHLTAAGLGRIYTKGIGTPDGRSFGSFKSHLKQLESEAKRDRLGGWGK